MECRMITMVCCCILTALFIMMVFGHMTNQLFGKMFNFSHFLSCRSSIFMQMSLSLWHYWGRSFHQACSTCSTSARTRRITTIRTACCCCYGWSCTSWWWSCICPGKNTQNTLFFIKKSELVMTSCVPLLLHTYNDNVPKLAKKCSFGFTIFFQRCRFDSQNTGYSHVKVKSCKNVDFFALRQSSVYAHIFLILEYSVSCCVSLKILQIKWCAKKYRQRKKGDP